MFSIWSLVSTYISVIWVNTMDDKMHSKQDNQLPSLTATEIESNRMNLNTRAITMADVLTNRQCMFHICFIAQMWCLLWFT